MTAAVLSIGTELTRGELVNSNATWLGDQLTALGFDVGSLLTIADDEASIVSHLRDLASATRVVISTGGLGPTSDDLTAAAVAKALGVPMVREHAVLEHIRRLYRSRGRELLPSNEKQAEFPEGARIIANRLGTAPGFEVKLGGCQLFFLPGVPTEMMAMFTDSVVPSIGGLVVRNSHQLHVRVFGLPESEVQQRLADIEERHSGVTLGYRAHFPEIEVKVLGRASTPVAAEATARAASRDVLELLGDAVFGDREDSFAGVVGETLRAKGLTLAVAESCTGGMVGAMLTAVPGSSEYLLLDAVTYANSAKTRVLGVGTDVLRAYGAVSAETAAAMADGALRVSSAELAVSITGIAGPGGGTDDKPVGTVWLGLAGRGRKTLMVRHQFHGDRDRVRIRAAYTALELVRRASVGQDPTDGPASSTRREVRLHS